MSDAILNPDGSLREPPSELDPFALFGFPRTAVLDSVDLRPRYLALSRAIHPDRFQAKGGEALGRADTWSGMLNRANRILRDTRERVLWLLDASGALKRSESEATGTAGVPPDLLMEVFELREALEELGDAPPDPADKTTLQRSASDLQVRLAAVAEGWEQAAVAHDRDGPAASAVVARGLLAQEQFLRRLLDEVEAVLRRT